MTEREQDPYVRVLLVESEKDTVSILTLSLSEIKECQLRVSSEIKSALRELQEREPDLILYSHHHNDKDSLRVLSAIHQKHPSLYMIVSLPEEDAELMSAYMKAGAHDCIIKDKNYISALVAAVKNALIRIAERESFILPPLSRADQFAMDENLPDLVFLIDREGKILHVNRAITDFLGFKQSQMIDHSFVELLGAKGQLIFREYLQRIDFIQNLRGTVPVKNSAGEEEQLEINCTYLEEIIYGVMRRDSSWEAVADMIDVLSPEETARLEDEDDELSDADHIPARLGPYRVITLLGAGAMGRVYKGYDEHLDRFVAIKVISRSLAADQEYLNRFHREAKILASISHPNIALVYHYGNTEGPPFFCMEFMAGGSLEDVLQKSGPIDPETAVSYAMQVALGLAEAAKKGVVHLDIKPSNLMIGENDRVKIVDFGLAKNARELERGNMGIVGTPHYIAPEQVQGNPVDFRADIYSLGVSLYRMLYGSMPFPGETLVEILHNQFHSEPPSRESLNPDVPAVLYEIMMRMIARDPNRRYSNYPELIQDLENWRRALNDSDAGSELPKFESAIVMRGLLYDRPFAEVLGEIIHRNLSGKLTLSWIDLKKNIQFKNGKILSVLSNQEGESFIDLLLKGHHLSTRKVKQIQSNSIDLFLHYSTAMNEIDPDVRENVAVDFHNLAWRILQGLFAWMVGEYIFEQDDFQGQVAMQIPAGDVLVRGIKEWIDPSALRIRLLNGNCRIQRTPDFQKLLPGIQMKPADTFLLFRFDQAIQFKDLYNLSGISEDEFYRLIYLFKCAGIVTIEPLAAESAAPSRASKKATTPPPVPRPARKEAVVPNTSTTPPATAPVPSAAPISASIETEGQKQAESKAPEPQPAGFTATAKTDMAKYYFNFALQSYHNKNYWAAVEYCKKSLEVKKDVSTYALMGNAFATHPNFRFEAMDAYKQALALDADNASIHRDMGDLYYKTGNKALARAKYDDVLKLDPTDSHATKRLAEISAKKKG